MPVEWEIAVKSELLGATSDGNVAIGVGDSPFVSDALAAAGDYQSAYAASYYSRYPSFAYGSFA